jgi:hypothetical protein
MRSLLEMDKINNVQGDNFSSSLAPKQKNKAEVNFYRAGVLLFYIFRGTRTVASFFFFFPNKLIPYIICDPELSDVVWIIAHKFVLQPCI